MILGVGTDIINIDRIEKLLKKSSTFQRRILSNQELEVYMTLNPKQQIRYLAKRFAAKEAIAKALGIGIGAIGLSNISVLNNNLGKPYVVITRAQDIRYLDQKNINIEISLSDEKSYALAFAIAYLKLPKKLNV
jgi:holo-[acyl-carrier protein] synthase